MEALPRGRGGLAVTARRGALHPKRLTLGLEPPVRKASRVLRERRRRAVDVVTRERRVRALQQRELVAEREVLVDRVGAPMRGPSRAPRLPWAASARAHSSLSAPRAR